jgi:hypothetical protein
MYGQWYEAKIKGSIAQWAHSRVGLVSHNGSRSRLFVSNAIQHKSGHAHGRRLYIPRRIEIGSGKQPKVGMDLHTFFSNKMEWLFMFVENKCEHNRNRGQDPASRDLAGLWNCLGNVAQTR